MPRKVFVAGEILTAADVNTNLMDQSVMVFDDATARATAIPTPVEGMVTYLKDINLVQAFTGSAFTAVGGIVQVVRATDTTNRTTTSATFVDANISVTITPTTATNNIMLIWSGQFATITIAGANNTRGALQISDSSNNPISGAEDNVFGMISDPGAAAINQWRALQTNIGFVNAGSTSAQTFKGRFRQNDADVTVSVQNSFTTGQLFAIELGA